MKSFRMGLPNTLAALIPVSVTAVDQRIQTNSGFTLKTGIDAYVTNLQSTGKREKTVESE